MRGISIQKKSSKISKPLPVLDTRDCYTCSFTEFLPFAADLYYFSSLKAFKTITPA